jgi:hypothetical protein
MAESENNELQNAFNLAVREAFATWIDRNRAEVAGFECKSVPDAAGDYVLVSFHNPKSAEQLISVSTDFGQVIVSFGPAHEHFNAWDGVAAVRGVVSKAIGFVDQIVSGELVSYTATKNDQPVVCGFTTQPISEQELLAKHPAEALTLIQWK